MIRTNSWSFTLYGMMRTLFMLIFCCNLFPWATAFGQQAYFNNRFDNNNELDAITSVLELENGYLNVATNGKIILLRIDTLGNTLWEKSFGNPNEYFYAGTAGSLVATIDGGYALSGSVVDSTGNSQALLVKFNSMGDTIWTTRYGNGAYDAFYQCKSTNDSGYIAIGTTSIGGNNILLIKTDSLGTLEWQKLYGGAGIEYGFSVNTTSDGGYILGGFTSIGAGNQDTYVIKVDSSGIIQWDTTFGGIFLDCGASISKTSDNGYIIGTCIGKYFMSTSYLQRQARIIRLDSIGNVIWDNTYGPARLATDLYSVYELEDGSFIAAGQRANRASATAGNGWAEGVIIKVDSQGDSLWYRVHQYDTCEENNDYLRDMKPTSDGGFIVAGFFTPRLVAPCNDTGTQDMWVMKLDSCGCAYVGCDSTCQGLVGIKEFQDEQSKITVYPNPFGYQATVRISPNLMNEQGKLEVYNITGEKVHTYKVQPHQTQLSISADEIGHGLFFLRLTDDEGVVASGKVVILK